MGLLASAGLAFGQSQNIVFTQDNDEPASPGLGWGATAPHVGVGQSAVVVSANRRLAIYDKTATQLELWNIATGSPAYPFLIDPTHTDPRGDPILFDPQSDYDPIANRNWLLYLEGVGTDDGAPGLGGISRLHLGVSKDPADFPGGGPLDTLADTHWWYYTHDTGTGTKAGAEFNLNASLLLLQQYKGESTHNTPNTTVRLASMGFDEQAIMVTPNDNNISTKDPFDPAPLYLFNAYPGEQYIYIIPRDHAGGSITDGDRPSESDITFINMNAGFAGSQVRVPDPTVYYRAVHEPYPDPASPGLTNQVENATFFISLGDYYAEEMGIRLRGIFDADPSSATDWTLQQHLNSSDPTTLVDMAVGSGKEFAVPTRFFTFDLPRTPDPAVDPWTPHAPGGTFQTAVLARDTEGDFRIFAAHAVHPIDDVSGQPTTQWVVQWYVIDPKLGDFGSATPTDWQPEIVAQGRIENEGDGYHPVMVVNRQGQAFIEYTYSDGTPTGWPQIRRVRLNNSYTVVVGSETLVLGGPSAPYEPANMYYGYWADYADAQADPFDNCRYWSTHTLVHDVDGPTTLDRRDVWLFRQLYAPNCFQSNSMLDLNDDTEVDAYDLAAFGPMFERGARRVDIDGNGIVEALDMVLFYDAYDAYTSR
jgi:hypothetical protein